MSLITMKVRLVVFVCFVSALLPVGADVLSFTRTEGQSITARCHFGLSGSRKFFCKGECRTEDILIETTGNAAHNGRYGLEFQGTYANPALFVTIKQLTTQDTGRYKCGLSGIFTMQHDIILTVKAVPTVITPVSTTPEVFGAPGVQDSPRVFPPVYVYPLVASVLVLVFLSVVVFYFLCKRKNKKPFDGENLDDKNMKASGEDCVYQSLNPAGMDPDQTYSTLEHKH